MPSTQRVALRLFTVHLAVAAVLTLFCPQLGVGPFLFDGHGLVHIFMVYGPVVCATACGAIFLGTCSFFAVLLLSKEELRVAVRHSFLWVSFSVSCSFSGLMLAGGAADRMSYLFWILGAFTAGIIVLRTGGKIRLPSENVRYHGLGT